MRNKTAIKKKRSQLFYRIITVVTGIFVIGSVFLWLFETIDSEYKSFDEDLTETFFSNHDPISCTIFTASHGDKVFFGNNEDWKNPKTYYWATPQSNGEYGVVYFGFDNFWPQGGINEKGLAFDVNALPRSFLNPHPELPKVRTPFHGFLKTCATVEEIIEKVKSYSWERSWKAQLHVADKMGNAVVISAGQDGEIAFTRKKKDDKYLLSTNFNLANPENGKSPCWRFNTASGMLKKIQNEETLTVDYLRSILDAVHAEGASINTVYSNIFDLTNGIVYLYHWHHYNEVVELNVAEEVTSQFTPVRIKDLFSQKTVDQTSKEFLSYRKKITLWKTVAWIWIILCGALMIVLLCDLVKGPQLHLGIGLVWGLVVGIFGPFGLIAYLYTYRRYLRTTKRQFDLTIWKTALGNTAFDVTGYAIGIAVAMSTFYHVLPLNESSFLSIAGRCYGLPLIIGAFFFHISVSATIGKNKYWPTIRHRILTQFLSLNLSLVGMLPVAGILLDLTEKHLGMDGPGSPIFWGIIALSAFSAAFIVYPFNVWRAHHRKDHL